jgi:hypothetical protein
MHLGARGRAPHARKDPLDGGELRRPSCLADLSQSKSATKQDHTVPSVSVSPCSYCGDVSVRGGALAK